MSMPARASGNRVITFFLHILQDILIRQYLSRVFHGRIDGYGSKAFGRTSPHIFSKMMDIILVQHWSDLPIPCVIHAFPARHSVQEQYRVRE